MPRNISFTKNQAIIASIVVSIGIGASVGIGAGCAFAFCAFVVLTA